MLLWTLRTWPKAQYLARALGIPPDGWEIPYMFVAVGGPELSVFEAMEKPELGGLTTRLKALTKPLAGAAYEDPWVRREIIGESKLAVAFHPGVTVEQVREMSERDGYRVWEMPDAMTARADAVVGDDFAAEGILDGHARLRRRSDGEDSDAVWQRTLALPAWPARHHSAAFHLAAQRDQWGHVARMAIAAGTRDPFTALAALILDDVQHAVLAKPLAMLASDPEVAGLFDDDVGERASQLVRLRR